MNNEAYNQGFANGQADRLFNYGSRLARLSFAAESEYVRSYAAGYRAGQVEAKKYQQSRLAVR